MATENNDKSTRLSLFLSALMVLSTVTVGGAAFAGTAAASSHVIVVDADGGADYSTIQGAVDAASPGDTIEVHAGTYSEDVTVSTENVTLVGPNAGTPGDGDRGNEAVVAGGIDIAASNVTVDGFTVEGTTGELVSLGGADYEVVNNVLDGSADVTVAYGKADGGLVANNSIVAGGESNYAVRIGDATGVRVVDNTFVQGAVPDGSSNTPQGVILSSTVDSTVEGNTFEGASSGQAVLVSNNAGNTSGVTVADNHVDGFANGVFLYENQDEIVDASVTGNVVTNVSDVGIFAYDNSGSDGFAAINGENSAAAQADALLAANDVGVVTAHTATVTADPVTVDDDGASDYASIQTALDVVPAGTTVAVAPGTYAENVTVSTANVTLVGPNAGTPGDGDRATEATINGQLIVSASNVTVDGFDVSPPNATTNQNDEALRVSGGADGVTVQNTVVRDFGEDGIPEGVGVDAINVFGGSSSDAVENVTIVDNYVHGISGRDTAGGTTGVSVQGNVVNATVADNTISNVGQGETAWAFGVTVRETGNHDVTPTNVEVVGNDISDVVSNPSTSTVGVGVGLESGSASDVTFVGNDISNAAFLLEDKTNTVDLNQFAASNTLDRSARLADGGNTIYGDLQPAVDAASSGDTVLLGPGTYEGSFDVATSNVTLVGTDGAENTTLDIGTDRINVQADNVTLHGVSVVFENQGVYVQGGADNVSVGDSRFTLAEGAESTGYGIRFEGSTSDGVVYDSEFVGINNTVAGEYGNGIVVSGPDGHVIVDNTFTNNSIGLNVGNSQPAERLYVANNTFTEQGSWAIALNHDNSSTPQFDITDNRIESNAVGVLVVQGGSINLYQNDIVDNGVAIQSLTDDSVYAAYNWWGSETGPTADAVEGDVYTNPFLTVPSADAADDPANLTEFGYTVEMDAGAHAFGVPGPVEGTVGSMFNDFNGTVYAFEDGSWTQVTNPDRKLSALDALLVIPDEGETARATIEIAEGSGEGVPPAAELDEGWNFVGAPQAGDVEVAYGASSADPARALQLYDAPSIDGHPTGDSSWTKHTFGTDSTGSYVSPVSGYWVYAEENGSVAGNVPSGVTLEEFGQLVSSETLIANS